MPSGSLHELLVPLQAARACGATHVTISDVQDARLALAKQLGVRSVERCLVVLVRADVSAMNATYV